MEEYLLIIAVLMASMFGSFIGAIVGAYLSRPKAQEPQKEVVKQPSALAKVVDKVAGNFEEKKMEKEVKANNSLVNDWLYKEDSDDE